MKIKWNWGTAIFIAIVVFMAFIFTLVYFTTQNTINLVEKDYYPKGLKFQGRIDEITNAQTIKDRFIISQTDNELVLSFPEIAPDTGTVVFFRPSDTEYDLTYKIQPDSLWRMSFSALEFRKGKYILKIHWMENEKGYYVEKSFYFK